MRARLPFSGGDSSRTNQHFAEDMTIAQCCECFIGAAERKRRVNHRLQSACRRPIERRTHISAIASVAADEPLLLYEERPEVQCHFPSGRCAAGHDFSVAREAIEAFQQYLAAYMLDDNVHTTFIRDTPDLGRPFWIVCIDDK